MSWKTLSKTQKKWHLIGVLYVLLIYWLLWVKTDNPSELQRSKYYDSPIVSLDCARVSTGKGGHATMIYTTLESGQHLVFSITAQMLNCQDFWDKVPNPVGKRFKAYFLAGVIMQLDISNMEVINFRKAKLKANVFASLLILFPYFVYYLQRYMREKYRRR